MPERLKNISSVGELLEYLKETVSGLVGNIEHYFTGASNIRIASIFLIVLALALFIFLIAILHMKNVISLIKAPTPGGRLFPVNNSPDEDWGNDFPDRRLDEAVQLEEDRKKELEDVKKEKAEALRRQEVQKEQKEKQRNAGEKEESINKRPAVSFDWEKSKIKELESAEVIVNDREMKYKPAKKTLGELTGLIIDMMSRDVDEFKIAQTLMFRTQGEVSEDEILQTIDAVKNFTALSVGKRFKALKKMKDNLPDEKSAIANLANGDASYALGLLEALMDDNINKLVLSADDEKKKNLLVKETSFVAIMFGNLANLSDQRLAMESFELAIDLHPENVNAWGRLADMHYKAGNHQKAIEAYRKLLDLADEEIYPRQVANAHQKLAQYYYEQGDKTKATKLYNSSKKYYDYIGINRNLEKQEQEVVEIIESRQKDELQNAITRLFNSKNRPLSYM